MPANHPNDLDDQAHPSGQLQLLEKLDSQLEGVGQHGSNLENIRIPEVNADIHALDTIAVALQLVPWRSLFLPLYSTTNARVSRLS